MMNKIVSAIERHQMLRPGDTVLVALSGGADSMALLYALLELKYKYSITLCAAHFNHCIRGEEAKRDENFVVSVCKNLGVELFIGSADIPALALQDGIGTEECGRRERYAFFERVAPNAKIATAHTLSDCEETFLFNLARGAALHGLGSIPPMRGNIIRPLIDCSRTEVEEFCKERKIEFVTDSTNLTDDYTRNRLRHCVVPELKKINPAFDVAFERCVNSLREDEELLSRLAEGLLEKPEDADGFLLAPLADAPAPLKKRAVAKIIEEITLLKPEARHIDAVCRIICEGGDTQVVGGVSLRAHGGRLFKIADDAAEWSAEMHFGINVLPYITLNVEQYEEKNKINTQKINKHLLAKSLDYDKIKGKLLFSSLHPGDLFQPAGRGVTKQLRRIFSEMHVEPEKRRRIALLRDEKSVVWVEGVGCAQRVCPTEKTKCILIIEERGT